MEEAECNRRGESKILTVFRLFIIEFYKFIPYIEKQHSYRLLIAKSKTENYSPGPVVGEISP